MRSYDYVHTVSFEETNLTGNVYYVNHLRWQGRCREMFLREHAPSMLAELAAGLALVTLSCSCEYLDEIFAFDQITVRMTLGALAQSRMTLRFEYLRDGRVVARGEQQIGCMRRGDRQMAPAPVPAELREALAPFAE
jgi:enediyne core biosynthesis thioesterase